MRLLQKIPAGDVATEARRTSALAVAYVREKRPDEAVKTAAEYAKENPRDSAAHFLYGTALVAAGKRVEARMQYSEVYKLNPKNTVALYRTSLARAVLSAQERKIAVGEFCSPQRTGTGLLCQHDIPIVIALDEDRAARCDRNIPAH